MNIDIAIELKRADHYLQAGNLQQAKEIYEKILDIYPDHPDVLHLLGLIAYQLNHLEKAKMLIQKAILNNTDNPVYHRSLGDVFKDQRRLDKAIENYQMALKLAGPDKILFGSDYPLLPPARYFEEIKEAELTDDEIKKICGSNAAKLLGI